MGLLDASRRLARRLALAQINPRNLIQRFATNRRAHHPRGRITADAEVAKAKARTTADPSLRFRMTARVGGLKREGDRRCGSFEKQTQILRFRLLRFVENQGVKVRGVPPLRQKKDAKMGHGVSS